MSAEFEAVYARCGRPSVLPEILPKALLLQILFSIRSERLLVQAIDDNLLYRWLVGLNIEDKVWDHPTFSANRERLFNENLARVFFERVSATDSDARPYKKAPGDKSRPCHMGHILMDNRHARVVDVEITHASGTAERKAALKMLARQQRTARRLTVGADKGSMTAAPLSRAAASWALPPTWRPKPSTRPSMGVSNGTRATG